MAIPMYWLVISFFVNSINYSLFIIFQCTKIKTTAITIKKVKNANNDLESPEKLNKSKKEIVPIPMPIIPPKRKPTMIPHPIAPLICSFISLSMFLLNKKPTTS